MTTENVELKQMETNENNEIAAKLPPAREERFSAKTNENYMMKDGSAYVGHSLALRLTGSSPATLHRYAMSGKLSYEKDENGHKIYQVAELERVFKKLKTLETNDNVSNEEEREQEETAQPDHETALKLALLQQENEFLKEQNATLQQNADDLRQAMKMLTYRPEPTPQPEAQAQPATAPKRGILGAIFGGRSR